MQVLKLEHEWQERYRLFLLEQENSLFYYSDQFRKILKEYLQAEDHYLIATEGNKILAALPTFLIRRKRWGSVLNSLPFYGSNGAVLGGDEKIKRLLISSFNDLAQQENCVSSTIITSPFEQLRDIYEKESEFTFRDQRIGQLTPLPLTSTNIEEELLSIYHYKTRNMIRKADKFGITVQNYFSKAEFSFLVETHQQNMIEINGISKSLEFFEILRYNLNEGEDYKIYTAYYNGIPIAALLLIYFNNYVEYFTPVVKKEYRTYQPLSLIIYKAMIDAVKDGYRWWNWGGTWLSQEGVYQFKKRWGTVDKDYYYYTRIYNEDILNCSPQELLAEYPYFYVVPFGRLRG